MWSVAPGEIILIKEGELPIFSPYDRMGSLALHLHH